ncbi:MAG TPA: branched-chain amino acid ABC transporter ATP-binding protein/permease [Candidatus Limnocylindrales bacterium]|nr:branched-chain amino acid ABC transporter ATP-binding protein/permease [Candidatus Limnocylindrales bacterium]
MLKNPLIPFFIFLLLLPFAVEYFGSTTSLATEIIIFTLLGFGYNLLLGYTGLVSFGHGAFFGLAAYAAALTQLHLSKGMILPLIVGILTATLLGAGVGFLIMRRRGVYFSLLTLAFTQMFFYIVYRATSITGGENGLGGITRLPVGFPPFFTLSLSNAQTYYYFVAIIVAISTFLIWRIVHSPFGKVLQAIRENEQRASCVGYNTKQYKLVAFIVSTTFTGLAGVLYAFLLKFVYPETVHVTMSGEIVAMTLVGGMHNFFGPAVGALFFIFLRDFLTTYTENWMVYFGTLFMLFILFSPEGLVGIAKKLFSFLPLGLWGRRESETRGRGDTGTRGGDLGIISTSSRPRVSASRDTASPRPVSTSELLVVKNLEKRFGALAATDNVSFSVREGELHSIIGPNGAGKTTFFNLLTGLLPVDKGHIFLKGEEITGLPPYAFIQRGISRSFQIISIFQQLTVLENIRIAVQAASKHRFNMISRADQLQDLWKEAERIVALVGLQGKEEVLASNLSHGDQRLLEIGIALGTKPDILLLDEPLAGLPPVERTRISKFIKELAGKLTILLIEHDIDRVLALSDRITVLHQGRVLAEGTPEEIQRNEAVQQAYLGGTQIRVKEPGKPEEEKVPRESRRPLLSLNNINTYYGKSHILHDVSLEIREKEVVCLLGRNGAGKTTTLKSIMGTNPPRSGQILFKDIETTRYSPESIARLGIGIVPEGRRIFPNLTVEQNLLIAYRERGPEGWNLEKVYESFPKLKTLRQRRGEHLSGGERQMLAIARALMGNVELLLLDEPFEGLAPAIVTDVYNILEQIRGETTLLLVEQNAHIALNLSDWAYIINNGQIIYTGDTRELMENEELRIRSLGV